jgi:hypothetical protein
MAQTSWNTNGNAGSFSNFIGTTNNFPFLFRTNNLERMRIQPNGFVGIGVANPLQRLDIFGNLRVRGNIYVDQNVYQQGQFDADTVDAGVLNAGDISATKVSADSIRGHVYTMDENSKFVGESKFQNAVKIQENLLIGENANNETLEKFEVRGGNAKFQGDVLTEGNSTFNGETTFRNGRMILGESQNKGIQVSTSSNQISEMNFGLINHSFLPLFCNSNSNPDAWHYNFNGSIRIYNWNNADGSTSATATALNIGHDSQNAVIDLSQGDDSGADGDLLINTYCGKDVVFGKLDNRRGNVFVNNKLGIGIGTEESNSLLEIGSNAFTGVEYLFKVKNTGGGNGLTILPNGKVMVNCNNGIPNGDEKLFVDGNIKVIGNSFLSRLIVNTTSNQYNANAKLAVTGLSIFEGNIITLGDITSKKIKVCANGWCDYVFEKEYKLTPLKEIEKFIAKNKHLPDVPSAKEIENQEVDIFEMQKIQMKKIEELTLYMIELKKENEEMKIILNSKK